MRRTVRRGAPVALLALVALSGASAVWWVQKNARPPSAPPSADSEPGSEFRGVELVDTDPDGTRWRLRAEEGVAWETEGRGELKGVKADFQRAGRALSAEAGRGEMQTRDVVRFLDGVTVRWQGYQVRLDDASYRRGDGKIVSDGPVTLTGPGLSVKGKGLEVDVEGKRAKILSGVSAVVGGGAK
jgi:LPS export ABC transporter protein LptC